MNPIRPHFSPSPVPSPEGARPAGGAARLGTSFRLVQPRFSGAPDTVAQLPATPLHQRQVSMDTGTAQR